MTISTSAVFQVYISVELNELWIVPVFYREIGESGISWMKHRHNPCDIYIKYDEENYFFFTGTYCHGRNDNIYSNFSATLICCCHLISHCQMITSGQQCHFLPMLPNRSVQDIKYACTYIWEEGEKWYKHFLYCRNTEHRFSWAVTGSLTKFCSTNVFSPVP